MLYTYSVLGIKLTWVECSWLLCIGRSSNMSWLSRVGGWLSRVGNRLSRVGGWLNRIGNMLSSSRLTRVGWGLLTRYRLNRLNLLDLLVTG